MWSVVGPLSDSYATMKAKGIKSVLLEMAWRDAEPTTHLGWNQPIFDSMRSRIAEAKAAGMQVILNFGMQEPPDWLWAQPNSRFVDQFGNVASTSQGPNLVWNMALRDYAQEYTDKVFSEFAASPPDIVRIGGGHWGEVTYPARFAPGVNSYWAFDANAMATYPVAGWRPGDAVTANEVDRFLNWYLGALINYQNWQVGAVRKTGYSGVIAILYPDTGFSDADLPALRASRLSGASSAEINYEVQRGIHHSRQIANLPTTQGRLAVWGTWATNQSTIVELSALANAKGLPLMGENSGDDISLSDFQAFVQRAKDYRMQVALWVRYPNLPGSFPAG